MKLQIASDLHLELFRHSHPHYPVVEHVDGVDALVLSGDIQTRHGAAKLFEHWPVPVIWVAGNHEYYGLKYEQVMADFKTSAHKGSTHFLENDELVLGGVRFLGCTLWTDYALNGDPSASKAIAVRDINDHHVISFGGKGRKFSPRDAHELHLASRAWLERKLAEPFEGKTVVITHHGVHPGSIHADYAGDDCNPAFVSDLTPLMGKCGLWIHGHVHNSIDDVVNGTRIVANPAGYARNPHRLKYPRDLTYENGAFNPQLVVEV